jgi:hypothetical protein
MEWLKPALLLIAIASLSYAALPGETIAFTICLPLAVGLAAAIIGLAYMAGQLFHLPGLDAWVKVELQELILSIVLVVLIAAAASGSAFFVGVLSGRALAPSYSSLSSEANVALTNMTSDLEATYRHSTRVLYNLNKVVGFSYSVSLSVFAVSGTYSWAPRSGLGPLAGAMINGMNSISNTLLLMEAQRIFLQLLAVVIPGFVLPAAVVLRTLPQTRKMGSTLIAVSIAGWLVYPAAVLFTSEIYNQIKVSAGGNFPNLGWDVRDIGSPPAQGLLCSKYVTVFAIVGEEGWSHIICDPLLATVILAPAYPACVVIVKYTYMAIVAGLPFYFGHVLNAYMQEGISTAEFFDPIFKVALPEITKLIVLDISLSIASMAITLSALRSIAGALGGEVQLYGLTKII